ncbi:MAG: radical SAM protein [Myxococcales bacterium]|nr:radical SAM protein [Myxococcales bacterium]
MTCTYLAVTDGAGTVAASLREASFCRSILESRGIRTAGCVVLSLHQSRRALLDELCENRNLKVVHFFVESPRQPSGTQLYFLMKWLGAGLRERRPDILQIASGDYATHEPAWFLDNNPPLDACVRYDPYWSVLALFERADAKRGLLDRVGSLVFRTEPKGAEYVETPAEPWPACERFAELDIIPPPWKYGADDGHHPYYYTTSIGCAYKCGFCHCRNYVASMRYFSTDRVIDDLSHINDVFVAADKRGEADHGLFRGIDKTTGLHELKIMFLMDLLFTARPKSKLDELLDRMAAEQFALHFGFETRAESINGEMLQHLFDAGFRMVTFGLESSGPETLRRLGKVVHKRGIDGEYKREEGYLERLRSVVTTANEIGFHTGCGMMFGIPDQSADEFRETVRFAKSIGADDTNQNLLALVPGLLLFDQRRDEYLPRLEKSLLQIHDAEYDIGDVWEVIENRWDPAPMVGLIIPGVRTLLHAPTLDLDTLMMPAVASVTNPTPLMDIAPATAPMFRFAEQPLSTYEHWLEASPLHVTVLGGKPRSSETPAPRGKEDPLNAVCDSPTISIRLIENGDGELVDEPPATLPRSSNRYCIWLLDVANEHDLEAFDRLNARAARTGYLRMPGWLTESWFLFLDSCRWAAEPCPSTQGFVVALSDDSGRFSPCMSGCGLVDATTPSMDAVGQAFERILNETTARRGCESCVAFERCSRCLCTAPLSEEQFCDLQRRRATRSMVVEAFHTGHEIYIDLHRHMQDGAPTDNFEISIPFVANAGLTFDDAVEQCGPPAEPINTSNPYSVWRSGDQYCMRAALTLRVFEISPELAQYCEMRQRGYSVSQVDEFMGNEGHEVTGCEELLARMLS